jgi:hypothetical protein
LLSPTELPLISTDPRRQRRLPVRVPFPRDFI